MGPPSPFSSTALSAWLPPLTLTSKPSILHYLLSPSVGCGGDLAGLHTAPSLTTPGLDLKRIDLWGLLTSSTQTLEGAGVARQIRVWMTVRIQPFAPQGRGGTFSLWRYPGGSSAAHRSLQPPELNPFFLLSGDKISINLFLIQLLRVLAETGLGFQHLHLPHPSKGR